MGVLHAHAMTRLETRFLPVSGLTPGLHQEIEALDRLAFAGQDNDNSIRWAPPEWMALGFLDEKLVSQLCLHKRQVMVGREHVWVGCVGGVATHPAWLRHGFASRVLHASAVWMRDKLGVPFSILLCAEQVRPLYEKCGWQLAASALTFTQDDQVRRLDTCVMVLPLADRAWSPGEINACGLPW